ncbi:SDR family NAD(P)-dependent oxidoreductase [Paracoccus sp. J55]|uniref:SDR family oxidoreductase n=1 Tax=Paracoccus sp. J55 TaxID=935849 RepID=UPI00048E2DD7|nr:SDR family NAD(P)-dependent oxidoreductase [Paracoccus sp. J55]
MTEQRIALVTGAAGGIGQAAARRLAEAGHRVILLDRDESVHELAVSLAQAEAAEVDLAQEGQILELIAGIAERHGRLDVLVNNAGISPHEDGRRSDSLTLSLADWDHVLRINLTSQFLLCREAIPLMRRHGWGRIINISSRAARTFTPTAGAHYSAAKAGIIGFSRILAGDYAADGITVNCVAPGRIRTALSETGSSEWLAELYSAIPVGRAAEPEEVAAMIAYLASDEAGFVTGAVFDINGGQTML